MLTFFNSTFFLPSLSLLQKLKKGQEDAIKMCTYLRKCGQVSDDITVMMDEMNVRKYAQYNAGKFIGFDKSDEFQKRIFVFMT